MPVRLRAFCQPLPGLARLDVLNEFVCQRHDLPFVGISVVGIRRYHHLIWLEATKNPLCL